MVAAYENGLCRSYEEVARMFGVGRATVSRCLRRKRETGDVQYKPRGHAPRKLDRDWLRRHARDFPDATGQERAVVWGRESGILVTPQTSVAGPRLPAMRLADTRARWG